MHFVHRFRGVMFVLVLATSCSDPADVPDQPVEIVVTAADFSFQAPMTVAAGLTRVRLQNHGAEFHHLQLVRLADGHTVEELLERIGEGDLTPPWAALVGGPGVAAQDGSSEVTVDLAAGEYVILCFITSLDGVPHLAKGMVGALTVTPSGNGHVEEPSADVQMVLDDFSFTISPEIRAGRHTIEVVNTAAQPHEVSILQLAPGKTLADALEFIEQGDGSPPFEVLGGTTGLGQGQVNFVTADFVPGEYVLLCFLPDATDGLPHVAHGMAQQIGVE